jgi:hypothetical protein
MEQQAVMNNQRIELCERFCGARDLAVLNSL